MIRERYDRRSLGARAAWMLVAAAGTRRFAATEP